MPEQHFVGPFQWYIIHLLVSDNAIPVRWTSSVLPMSHWLLCKLS